MTIHLGRLRLGGPGTHRATQVFTEVVRTTPAQTRATQVYVEIVRH